MCREDLVTIRDCPNAPDCSCESCMEGLYYLPDGSTCTNWSHVHLCVHNLTMMNGVKIWVSWDIDYYLVIITELDGKHNEGYENWTPIYNVRGMPHYIRGRKRELSIYAI